MSKKQKIILSFSFIAIIILYSPLTDGMGVGIASLLIGVSGTGLSGIIGYLALMQLKAFKTPTSAKEFAKIWFGYVFAILCVVRLNSFLVHLDMEYLAQFVILTLVYGVLAAALGYMYGRFKLRKK